MVALDIWGSNISTKRGDGEEKSRRRNGPGFRCRLSVKRNLSRQLPEFVRFTSRSALLLAPSIFLLDDFLLVGSQ